MSIRRNKSEKGIEVWTDYDCEGRWCLKIKKAKGKFSLDEITDIAKEYEEDFYAVIINAMSEETIQYYDIDYCGDFVTLYRAIDFLERKGGK